MNRPGKTWMWTWCTLPTVLIGCASADHRKTDDPLYGGTGAANTQQRVGSPPPPTTPQWSNSTAALTANPRPGLGADQRLAIENRQGNGQYLPPIQQTNFANGGLTLPQARERLKLKGASLESGEFQNGQYVYRCIVADQKNPNASRMYEAQDVDELSARRKVLEQMDKGL